MVDNKLPDHRDCFRLKEDEEDTRQIALARCNCLMDRYKRGKRRHHRKSSLAHCAALIFIAIIPVLILIPSNPLIPQDFLKLLGAALSAPAAIATGLLARFGWQENYIRYGYTWHALQTEKYRYLTKTMEEYSDEDEEIAVRNFARRIEQLVMAEVTDWRAEMERVEQQTGKEQNQLPITRSRND